MAFVDQIEALMASRICQDRPGISPLRLVRASIARAGALPHWPQLADGLVVLTHQARIGIAALCRHWQIGPEHEILAPAYNCGTELDALCHNGAQVRFYRVDEHARIDMDDLCARVTDRTRMIYVTHYFGWPQPLAELASWCKHRDIRLAEDCALALFSYDRDAPIGLAGDAAVFSFPKTLAVPDGGGLVLRQPGATAEPLRHRPAVHRTARRTAGLARNWLAGTFQAAPTPGFGREPEAATDRLKNPDRPPDMPASYYHDPHTDSWTMSATTAALLRQTDALTIVQRRRSNYLRLDRLLHNTQGVCPLYQSLPEGVCPLAYPLLVTSRPRWISSLRARGISAIPWWEGHHRHFDWGAFPEAHDLKMRVLALPVHQDLNEEQIDYIGATVISLA